MLSDQAPAATSGAGRLLTERARAKVNLTLKILGRRPDGYHALDSLVAFADIADSLTLDPAGPVGLTVSGPFATALAGHHNLAMRALDLAAQADPGLRLGALHLEKHLPVAAGIGGGSADAAAALRLVRTLNPDRAAAIDWMAIAARLGADVPVCFTNALSVMTETGDRLEPVSSLAAPLAALLVNPRVAVPANKTAAVFKALAAAPVPTGSPVLATIWPGDRAAFVSAVIASGNDLEVPAAGIVPAIAEVLSALKTLPGARLARLSGAGPTCFALFDREAEAAEARVVLARWYPDWWIMATKLS